MTATWINLIGLIFLMLLQPIGGIISDRVGRKPLLLWFGFGGLVYTYVLITYLPRDAVADHVAAAGRCRLHHPDRLHLDQRTGEIRAVPGTRARARSGSRATRWRIRCSVAPRR